jgi:hypothetical protein
MKGLGCVMVWEKLWLVFPLVDVGSLQFIAQQSLAAETRGESFCSSAFLQQSIMPDSPPPECTGIPATTLEPIASMSNKLVSLLNIANEQSILRHCFCQI